MKEETRKQASFSNDYVTLYAKLTVKEGLVIL